ncbi:class I SAM-dependent methyltransferase [Alkaliphilus hydrothermalis]|uniref:AdoMet-dependent methyltransferase n=1 Tax=Alkaliphilus hydrothermalis TaxID=1482730 RepID=A0ABS2NLK5_9FIRM|nr:class I SAM-dependent methyltransferase [Alkaliphilus hydrothermalis]MBM7613796.1 putative AdoMet-dependent methyltransferase [Alkaliphilus hydrothermalis]
MLNNKGFDQWAGSYDEDIAKFSKGYPFEGYYDVLGYIHSLVEEPKGKNILDIGVGTGLLSYELYLQGANVYGLDFSQKMLELAKEKMPKGNFYQGDIKDGVPLELKEMKFDYIVSSFAIHHVDLKGKIDFINKLKNLIKDNGKIIFGDVAFETTSDLEKCKTEAGRYWDTDEYYMVLQEMEEMLKETELKYKYTQISSCAGALELWK